MAPGASTGTPYLGGVVFNDLLVDQVRLVANEQLVDALAGVPIDFQHPRLDIVECFLVRHVVHDNDAVGAAVVGRGDGAETLLPGRVPNLQLHRLAFQLDRSDLEVYANGADVAFRVSVILGWGYRVDREGRRTFGIGVS